jgi:hypothetical protein
VIQPLCVYLSSSNPSPLAPRSPAQACRLGLAGLQTRLLPRARSLRVPGRLCSLFLDETQPPARPCPIKRASRACSVPASPGAYRGNAVRAVFLLVFGAASSGASFANIVFCVYAHVLRPPVIRR